jgi:hypothetical protein
MIAAATEAPRGQRSHAVRAHVAEGHGAIGYMNKNPADWAGLFISKRTLQLFHLDVFRSFLALVSYELVFDYCALIERAQARSLHGGDMHEHIFAAALRRNEAISLSRIEPLHGTCCHNHSPLFTLRAQSSYGRALTPDTVLKRKRSRAQW